MENICYMTSITEILIMMKIKPETILIEEWNEIGNRTAVSFVPATNKGDNIALDTYKCARNIWGVILIPPVIAIGFQPGLQPWAMNTGVTAICFWRCGLGFYLGPVLYLFSSSFIRIQ